MEHQQSLKSYKIDPSELESILSADFGDKLQPVNHAKLKFQQLQRQRVAAMRKTSQHRGDIAILESEDE